MRGYITMAVWAFGVVATLIYLSYRDSGKWNFNALEAFVKALLWPIYWLVWTPLEFIVELLVYFGHALRLEVEKGREIRWQAERKKEAEARQERIRKELEGA